MFTLYSGWAHGACVLLVAGSSFVFGEEKRSQYDRPAQEVVVHKSGGKATETGHVDGRIWIISVVPFPPRQVGTHVEANNPLHVWQWKEGTLEKHHEIASLPPHSLQGGFQWLSKDRYIAMFLTPTGSSLWPVVLRDADNNQDIHEWPWSEALDWGECALRTSANGKFVALVAREGEDAVFDWKDSKCRVGLLDVDAKRLDWIITLNGAAVGCQAIPSNDGTRVGLVPLAGPTRTCAMIDVSKRELSWSIPMPHGPEVPAARFSADSRTLFVGCEGPFVRGLDVESGRETVNWNATPDGKLKEFWSDGQVTDLDVSPDGDFVAATTDCSGEVYVWSVNTGMVSRLHYSDDQCSRLVAFSPDSKQLATVDDRRLRIWPRRVWTRTRGLGPGGPG